MIDSRPLSHYPVLRHLLSRRHLLGSFATASGALMLPARLQAAETVAPGGLEAALATAAPGTVLRLASGDHGALTIRKGGGRPGAPVTVAAADPARPPRFSRMTIGSATHLVLEDLHFDYTFAPGDPDYILPFEIRSSSQVTFRRCLFDGDLAQGLSAIENGFGWGTGFLLGACEGLLVEGCEIRGFIRGLHVDHCRDVIITGNDLHSMRSDSMSCEEVQNILIEANHFHDFLRSPESGDHPDMIQFWNTNSDAPSTGVVIRGNLLSSGRGIWTQSIFIGNELVRSGQAGREMFYRDLVIEENVILNAHLHGITLGESEAVTIRQNTLLRNPLSEGDEDNPQLWTPRINVMGVSHDVTITRNVVAAVAGYEGQPDWRVADNIPVQDRTRLEPNFVGLLFEGDPADPANLRYRPGGPLDGAGIGAASLQRS